MKPNWRYHQHAEQACDTGACDNRAAFLVVTEDGARRLRGECFLAMMKGKAGT